MIGMRFAKPCPNCGGLLHQENDGREDYLSCLICSREFSLELKPRRMDVEELKKNFGITLKTQKR